ncbi:MAG: hypothetical protein C5B51_02500 [Terriglobia bacterium]|nr:MAG: hypothetical protein C5B51_02500 [Terriglobia bacterium]
MKHLGQPAVRLQLLNRLTALRPSMRPHWGSMTAHGMICHLADSFRVAMGERYASPATGVLQRSIMKWAALYVPLHWPKGIRTRPEVEQGNGGTLPEDFRQDHADLIRLVETFAEPPFRFLRSAHPIFGSMREWEWLRWGFLHMDHHLRQFGV